jgi:putative transposase
MTLRELPVAEVRAFVVLPDRMHAIWKMPEGECAFPRRWSSIKGRFTRGLREGGRASRDEHIWGKRVWAQCLRSEADFAAHMQICWQAPVVAGLVSRAEDWPFSSFAREAALGRRQAVG